VGVAASALRLGAGVGRLALLPGRLLARSPFVEPALRGRAEALAAAGREAEARGRRQLEAAAGGLLASPETARTLDRALTDTVPEALGDEAIETLARRLLESPAFERVLRDAAESRLARELLNDAVHSSELQRAIEEALAAPAVRHALRNSLRRETKTLWGEVAARIATAAVRLDASVERVARRALGRPERSVATTPGELRHAGLASRGAGFLVDSAVTQLGALVVGALVAFVASSLGLSAPGWLAAVFAGTTWTLVVGGYFVLFWTTVGQTPGMRVAGLRVAGSDGQPPGALRSLVRFVGLLIALAPFGLGFVPVLFDSRRRALHDYLVGTVVVREAAASP
jgi:uncharacterized RDD family membrane protein YckC